LHTAEIAPAIVGALEQIAAAIDVDGGLLVEFAESPEASVVHAWAAHDTTLNSGEAALPAWLLGRLVRHEVVNITRSDDWPHDQRPWAERAGARSILGVPVIIAGQLVCALMVWTRRAPHVWSDPVVERMGLIAEILGVAVQRCRHETALQASLATIERLNARLEADNVYLKEEIWGGESRRGPRTSCNRSSNTRGPATFASWRTLSSGP
jgi:GAF domain-containing protein